MQNKLKLYGFNNLTKALSFNIYDVCYAKTEREQRDYIAYIDEQYNSERLTGIMERVTEMIGAHVLHISKQDYDPQGASVTFLIAEEHMKPALEPDTIVAHLDKSHVTVHTYPEYHPDTCLATFRVDIDVATCGEITPLSTLDYLIGSFDSDIITMDYRVRGFTRDMNGQKLFIDHPVTSIQDYINPQTLRRYDADRGAPFVPFAAACIRHAQQDARRAATRKKHAPLNDSVPLPEDEAAPGPEELAIASETFDRVVQRIRTLLSPLERAALLASLDGRSAADTARAMGCTPKAVENALARARRKLRAAAP